MWQLMGMWLGVRAISSTSSIEAISTFEQKEIITQCRQSLMLDKYCFKYGILSFVIKCDDCFPKSHLVVDIQALDVAPVPLNHVDEIVHR